MLLTLVWVRTLAADVHVTPTGAGARDGREWDSAFADSALAGDLPGRLQPGDRLLLGGGVYTNVSVTLSASGTSGKPIRIEGVDRGAGLPVFASDWTLEQPARGNTAIILAAGVSHVEFRGLRIRGYRMGVRAEPAPGTGTRAHLVFADIDIQRMRHGFHLSDCDDLRLEGCDLTRYSKHGFRFDQGCDRVTLKACRADCSEGDAAWEDRTELFPFGFLLNDAGAPNTNFTFTRCVAQNNRMPLQTTKYKNGDGFVVEANAVNVRFTGCRALRNQDGGFDLKVADVRLEDCVAVGNSRAFRIWRTGALVNCLAGWGSCGLWNNGGPVSARRCTFHHLTRAAAQSDDSAEHPVTLLDCLISETPAAHLRTARGGDLVMTGSVVVTPGGKFGDPRYAQPNSAWDGAGPAMNSGAYPDKGYRAALEE